MSLSSFLKKIETAVKGAAVKVADAFVKIFGKQASQQFGEAALALLRSDLGQVVVSEVEALAGATNLTGAQKAAQAQAAILKQAETLGKSASTSIINMLIELTVQFVTGNLTAVEGEVTTPAPPASH